MQAMDSKQKAGGLARAANLTQERRAEIAREAARVRWTNAGPPVPVSYVYVIGPLDGPQKIGIAQKPAARCASLQIGNHRTLAVSSQTKVPAASAASIERRAHYILRDSAVRGEWFSVSPQEARAAIAQAIKDLEEGRPNPEPEIGGLRVTFRLPPSLHEPFLAYCEAHDIRPSELLRQAVEKFIDSREGGLTVPIPEDAEGGRVYTGQPPRLIADVRRSPAAADAAQRATKATGVHVGPIRTVPDSRLKVKEKAK